MKYKNIFTTFVFALISFNAAANEPNDTVTEVKTNCSMQVPQSWNGKTMTWSGYCKNNIVDGNGVATIFNGQKVVALWYGDTLNGAPSTGIVEFPGKPSKKMKSTFELMPEKEIFKDPTGNNETVVQFQNAYNALEIAVQQSEYAKNQNLANRYTKTLRDIFKYFSE